MTTLEQKRINRSFAKFVGLPFVIIIVLVAALSPKTPQSQTAPAPAARVEEKSPEQKAEDAKRTTLNLAGTIVNFSQFCEREWHSLTPLQRDALVVYVQRDSADKYGNAAVKEATAKSYADGYYQLGERWCSIGHSAAKSIANAMTRNVR